MIRIINLEMTILQMALGLLQPLLHCQRLMGPNWPEYERYVHSAAFQLLLFPFHRGGCSEHSGAESHTVVKIPLSSCHSATGRLIHRSGLLRMRGAPNHHRPSSLLP